MSAPLVANVFEHPVLSDYSGITLLETAKGWAGDTCLACGNRIQRNQWCYGGSGHIYHYKCITTDVVTDLVDGEPATVNKKPHDISAYLHSMFSDTHKMVQTKSGAVSLPSPGHAPTHEKVTLKFLPSIEGVRLTDRILRRYWREYYQQMKAQPSGSSSSWSVKQEQDTNKTAYKLWNLPVVRLPQYAAEFYLLELMVSVHEYEPARLVFEEKINFLAHAFSAYMNMAIGGELRHMLRFQDHKNLSSVEKGLFPETDDGSDPRGLPRSQAWVGWYRQWEKRGIEAVRLAYEIFDNQHSTQWEGGFGGKAWSKIAETLLLFLTGKLRPKLFVDRVWSIQHNGGTALDKAPEMFRGLSHLRNVLDAQAQGDLSTLYQYAGPVVKKLFDEYQRG